MTRITRCVIVVSVNETNNNGNEQESENTMNQNTTTYIDRFGERRAAPDTTTVKVAISTDAGFECVKQIIIDSPFAVYAFGYRVVAIEKRGTETFVEMLLARDGFSSNGKATTRWMRTNVVGVLRSEMLRTEIKRFAVIAQ